MLNLRWSSQVNQGLPGGSVVKNLPANAEMYIKPWARKIPWRRKWQSPSSILYGKMQWTEEPGMLHSVDVTEIQKQLSNWVCTVKWIQILKLYRLSEMFYLLFRNWKASKASFTYYCHRLPIFFFFGQLSWCLIFLVASLLILLLVTFLPRI